MGKHVNWTIDTTQIDTSTVQSLKAEAKRSGCRVEEHGQTLFLRGITREQMETAKQYLKATTGMPVINRDLETGDDTCYCNGRGICFMCEARARKG